MRPARTLIALVAAVCALAAIAGCTAGDEPVVESREALGTVVSITAYGSDEQAVRGAIDDAFTVMAEVEAELDAHDESSAIAAFNADPYEEQALPAGATEILDAIERLGVDDAFSPRLLAVVRLYRFEDGGTVPAGDDLELASWAASEFLRLEGDRAAFVHVESDDARLEPGGELAPGLDLGGAAKGLAMDRARESLRASGAVTAALISSGSSTVTLGTKPDGSVWRIGIEDPRDPEEIVATFAFTADGALSTSGDYQRYFEAEGRRYHHLLDPVTGLPAAGMRSLTVAGSSLSGLDSDILSTALFVRGGDEAESYAADKGIALYAVDTEGRTLVVPAPEDSGLTVAEKATPEP
ncbi:MAG: FAD:protein FMN transferase [Coriobacteriia bacterium]